VTRRSDLILKEIFGCGLDRNRLKLHHGAEGQAHILNGDAILLRPTGKREPQTLRLLGQPL